jgi:small multidrug resistance pump
MQWLYLAMAIGGEVLGTSALKLTDGISRPYPLAGVLIGYCCAFYFLSLALRTLPIGIAYAVWSGVGVVCISLIGLIFYRERLNATAMVGIALIVIGVVILNTSIRRGPP